MEYGTPVLGIGCRGDAIAGLVQSEKNSPTLSGYGFSIKADAVAQRIDTTAKFCSLIINFNPALPDQFLRSAS